MNSEMKATAVVVAEAKKLASAAARLTRHTYWDSSFDYEKHFVIPEKYLDALLVAIEDRDELIKLDEERQKELEIQDVEDTIAAYQGDILRAKRYWNVFISRGGAKRG